MDPLAQVVGVRAGEVRDVEERQLERLPQATGRAGCLALAWLLPGCLRPDVHAFAAALCTDSSDIFRKIGASWAVIH